MKTLSRDPVFHPCDFCKARGILEVHIFNREGWYFCIPCLQEMAASKISPLGSGRHSTSLVGKDVKCRPDPKG